MSVSPKTAHDQLVAISKELSVLQSCSAVLEWDESTCLPPQGVAHRSTQLALMARLENERAADPRVGEWIDIVAHSPLMDQPAIAADVHTWQKWHRRAVCLPPHLVEEIAATLVMAQQAWSSARDQSHFAALQPWLVRVLDLKRQEAAAIAPGRDVYDTLLDEFEPGVRAADLEPFFTALTAGLSPLVRAIHDRPRPTAVLQRPAPIDKQRRLCEQLAAHLGYDFAAGRLDTSDHPFTIYLGPGDTRITTRFDANDVTRALFATLHEVGHGLYNQGLDPDAYGRAAGETTSAALHESQARLVENIIGRSLGFWRDVLPRAQAILDDLGDVTPIDAFRSVHIVQPGELRLCADEFTYDLHIAVRFQLERALIAGRLAVADLPAAWNDAYREHLGVSPSDDAAGCLQDGHWAAGMFGYFPTYTLGNAIAAQLFRAAEQTLGPQDERFAQGDYAPLLSWLRTHVHRIGSLRTAHAIVEEVTGQKLRPDALVARLTERSRQVYGT